MTIWDKDKLEATMSKDEAILIRSALECYADHLNELLRYGQEPDIEKDMEEELEKIDTMYHTIDKAINMLEKENG